MVNGKVFRFEKAKWKNRARNLDSMLIENLYYGMMHACWNGNADENDRIKQEVLPCVKREIIKEMTRLKKKVGI